MALATFTLRDHLANVSDARVIAPTHREEDLSQLAAAAADSVAVNAPLIESGPFRAIPVSRNEESGLTHFLDGAQRSWRVGFVGMAPIYLAHTSAGLLE